MVMEFYIILNFDFLLFLSRLWVNKINAFTMNKHEHGSTWTRGVRKKRRIVY